MATDHADAGSFRSRRLSIAHDSRGVADLFCSAPVVIREAVEGDIPALLEMAGRFHKASGFTEIPFDADSVAATMAHLIGSEDAVLVIGDGGMAAAIAYPAYFNHAHRQAQEMFWWVDEDKRSTGLGKALLGGIEAWARSRGAESMTMISLDALEPERVDLLYRRAGYRPSERNYLKRL